MPGDLARAVALATARAPGGAVANPGSSSAAAAVLALIRRYEGPPAPTGEIERLERLPAAVSESLAGVVSGFLAFDAAARGGDPAGVPPARGVLLGSILAAQAALAAAGGEVAEAPLEVGSVISLDLGSANNTYTKDFALLIDAGGNDVYRNNAGGSNVNSACATAARGAAALVDLAGDDRYDSGRSCGINGGGFIGSGLLVDAGGDDFYEAGSNGTNGGAQAGSGLLLDAGGNDRYSAGASGVNGGSVAGAGLLIDAGGNDSYQDAEGGGGADRTVLAKGRLGTQLDLNASRRGSNELVSLGWMELAGDRAAYDAAVSSDGRFVAFTSASTSLVRGDTNGRIDVFVRDRLERTTERASVGSGEEQGVGPSSQPSISADGRFVAFMSFASNLVTGDANLAGDVFVRDLALGTTALASLASDAAQGLASSYTPSISADGRYVAFASDAPNLVGGDTNGAADVFVRDLLAGTTRRVSLALSGVEANGGSREPSISADGTRVVFPSAASNLVPGDTNGKTDIFVRDLAAGTTVRASVGALGEQVIAISWRAAISAGGRYVVFDSLGAGFVAGDGNFSSDVFVRDLEAETTERVSLGSFDQEGNGHSIWGSTSADGRYVAFASKASNFGGHELDTFFDIFLRDRLTGVTAWLSTAPVYLDAPGQQGNGPSEAPVVSADGTHVAFQSFATNLGAVDANGQQDVYIFGPVIPRWLLGP